MKLFELNINIVCVHVAGHKNSVADFLSRIYSVEDCRRKEKSELGININRMIRKLRNIWTTYKTIPILGQ